MNAQDREVRVTHLIHRNPRFTNELIHFGFSFFFRHVVKAFYEPHIFACHLC